MRDNHPFAVRDHSQSAAELIVNVAPQHMPVSVIWMHLYRTDGLDIRDKR